jgi:hypothetical protein
MHFCTITTSDHYYKVLALRDSLQAISETFRLHILNIDAQATSNLDMSVHMINYDLSVFKSDCTAQAIIKKYSRNADKLRWSFKPIFLKYLLRLNAVNSVIYLDNDIAFFSEYSFLFELLNIHSFLLTPHHYERSPKNRQNMLEANFRLGLYNAGFIGVNRDAKSTLQWWAECCLYRCEKNAFRGTYDDQKYLDLVPIIDQEALVLRHQGCNVAEWNRNVCIRTEKDGHIYINNTYPLVFIHFNFSTVREIVLGNEPLLLPFYNRYFDWLKKYNTSIKRTQFIASPTLIERIKYKIWKFATEMDW